ncbi:MAG TPA: condensation domain-containing protein, partial [Pyrinomonadaceae bacterium]|nr:condensation domain-containing protein [Pyrinomonadaceae bacterium]
QHWFFEHQLPEPHHWNQASMLEVRRPIEPAVLEKAWQQVVSRHDALRLRFSNENGKWQQLCAPSDELAGLTVKSFAGVPENEQETALNTFAADFQKSLDLSAGPIARLAFIDFGAARLPRLLFAVHHLAVDVVSWGVMLEELQLAWEQIGRDEPVSLPAKTTSFVTWARRLEKHAQSEPLRNELSYWTTALDRWACRVPVDQPQGINTQESARIVWVSLDEERTRTLLQEVPKVYRTMINDVLLTAMVQAFCDWTQSRSLLIDLENHGREDIFDDVDLSRTVGWFTCIFPLLLEAGDASRPEVILKSVKEQIRSVPSGGIGYGLLRYLSTDAATRDALRRLPQAEVCFNYLGRAGQLADDNGPFAPKGSPGQTRGGAGRRRYLIEVDAGINNNQLRAAWTYSENLHSRTSIERFANGFITALEAIIDHCSSPDAGGFTPSDFSIPNLSQRELDRLIAELGGGGVKG